MVQILFLFGNLVLQQKTNFKDKEGHYVNSLRKEKLKLLFQTVAENRDKLRRKADSQHRRRFKKVS